MNSTPSLSTALETPKTSVETARLVLEQALKAEKKDNSAEVARKRALNACTGASALVPPEVIATAATAVPEQEQGS